MAKRPIWRAELPAVIRVSCENLLTGRSVITEFTGLGPSHYEVQTVSRFPLRSGRRRRVRRPLTWLEVAKFGGTLPSMTAWGDLSEWVEVEGVEDWQRDLIVAAMTRQWSAVRVLLLSFLTSQSEWDLTLLHQQYGLLSEALTAEVARLAAVLPPEWKGSLSLERLRSSAGVPPDAPIPAISAAFAASRDLRAIQSVDRLLRRADSIPDWELGAALGTLALGDPPLDPPRRTALFALLLRAFPKPVAALDSTEDPDEAGFLDWLLCRHATSVFRALRESKHAELQAFTYWFLGRARSHVAFVAAPSPDYAAGALGRRHQGRWASVAVEIHRAARAAAIPVPPELAPPASLPVPVGKRVCH